MPFDLLSGIQYAVDHYSGIGLIPILGSDNDSKYPSFCEPYFIFINVKLINVFFR